MLIDEEEGGGGSGLSCSLQSTWKSQDGWMSDADQVRKKLIFPLLVLAGARGSEELG